jgi:hypothetical protein
MTAKHSKKMAGLVALEYAIHLFLGDRSFYC